MWQDDEVGARAKWAGLPRRVALGFALAVAALCASAVLSLVSLRARGESGRLAAHTAACQRAAEEIESAFLVADAALDAYLARPEPRRLERYRRARSRIGVALARLAAISEADPTEAKLLERLRPAAARVLATHAEAIALVEAGALVRARESYDGEAREAAIVRAHQTIAELVVLETREAAERDVLRVRAIAATYWACVAADVVLLVLVLGAGRVVRDEIRRRERASAMQQRLVAIVSHDLRNPLCAVLGSAWTLARADLSEEARRAVRRISSSGNRMHRLIRDLLDWSRAHAGAEIPMSCRETDLGELCARIAAELGDAAAVRVEIVVGGDPRADVDPDRVEQVVANLLTNALRHGPPDRPVRVRVDGADEEVRIAVRDEGPGIAPEVRAELFEPFRRSRARDARGDASVGLGLFVVRTLTEAHGGKVEVESAAGSGTTFSIHLPRRSAARARDLLAASG